MMAIQITAWENGAVIHYAGPEDGTYEDIMNLLEERYGHYEKVSPAKARDIRAEIRKKELYGKTA